jgi:DNA-binding NarL/FixJ family response regulator
MTNPSFTEDSLVRDYGCGLFPAEKKPLSVAEHEIMDLICEGRTNPEIAYIRLTSCATAKAQVQSCLAKLGARNRTHAAAIYARAKLHYIG